MCFETLWQLPTRWTRQWLRLSWPPVLLQRLDVALVAPGTVQTNVINSVTAAGGTAEEWSDGDLTTVRGAEKLREWIMTKSPRLVWFCCPAENSTPSESSRSTAVQSRPRHQSREHRIQRHMSNLAADMASSGQCDIVLQIPRNSRAVRPGGCIHERRGFIEHGFQLVRGVCELIQWAWLKASSWQTVDTETPYRKAAAAQ